MIGSQQLIIDWKNFTAGMSTSDDIQDGGFSPKVTVSSAEQGQVNLISKPGVLYGSGTATDADPTTSILDAEIIAGTQDHNTSDIDSGLFVADNGTFYKYNGTRTQYPNEASAEDSANTFQEGFTDAMTFAGASFFTSKEKITKWSGASTFDHDYTTSAFTNTTYPHPNTVFENNGFYGDKNLLLRQTSVTATPTTILTLSSDSVIIALGIDPGTGKMLISTTNNLNISNTLPSLNRVLWYDGFSNKVSKSIIVEDAVLSFRSLGSAVMVTYGLNVGYLNGSGIQFLRKLNNAGLIQDELPYKHHTAVIGNTYYVVDKNQILAFGDVLPGKKVWYHAWEAVSGPGTSADIRAIFPVGSNKLAISVETNDLYVFDVTASGGRIRFATHKYNFERPVYIRSAVIEYADAVANADNNRNLYYSSDAFATETELAIEGNTTATLKNETGGTVLQQENIIGVSAKTRIAQFRYYSAVAYGVKRIIIYYDYAE